MVGLNNTLDFYNYISYYIFRGHDIKSFLAYDKIFLKRLVSIHFL